MSSPGEGAWGLPGVLISHEQNISHVSCHLFCRYTRMCLTLNNQHVAIRKCQDSSTPHREGGLTDAFSVVGGGKWLY